MQQTIINKHMKHFIYKTIHTNGKYYIGRHSTDNIDDGYLGSGLWPRSIKDRSSLKREILEYAPDQTALKELERKYLAGHYGQHNCMNQTADPSGKNLQFIARLYSSGQFKIEDCARIKDSIALFMKFRNKLAIKDINQLSTLDQLYDLTEPLEVAAAAEPVSNKQAVQAVKQGAKKVIDTPNFKVIIPETEEAACLYGAGTKWCTAAKENNMFSEYSKQGPLFVIIANIGGKQRKFQLSVETSQYMNERDTPISKADIAALSKIPEYTTFLNMLIKKYYSKYLDAA